MEKGEHSQHCRNVYVSLNLSKYAHAVSDDTLKDIAEKAINQNNVGELLTEGIRDNCLENTLMFSRMRDPIKVKRLNNL